MGDLYFGLIGNVSASVEIPRKRREVATGNFYTEFMSLIKQVSRRIATNGELVNFARRKQLFATLRIAIAGAHDAVGHAHRATIGSHIYQFCSEVGISCTIWSEESNLNRVCYFQIPM